MQNRLFKFHTQKLFLFAFLAICSYSSVIIASAQSKTLADGNPPLTSGMVNRFHNLMEWSLDVQFDAQDRSAVEKQLIKYWQKNDEKEIKAVLNILDFEKNLANASPAKKQEVQPQLKSQLLETMQAESNDGLNAVLLSIYNKNQTANSASADSLAVADTTNGEGLDQLVGKWQVLHGNSIVRVDIPSGRIGDGNSMIAQFDIRPDGGVIYTFVMQQANYGCTTRIKTSKTGRAIISGARITFAYDGGTTISEDSCNARYNYTKKLAAEKETYEFKLQRDSNNKPQFCFASPKLKDCAIRVK